MIENNPPFLTAMLEEGKVTPNEIEVVEGKGFEAVAGAVENATEARAVHNPSVQRVGIRKSPSQCNHPFTQWATHCNISPAVP